MKKILLCLGIVFLISGCGEQEKMLTCTSNTETNGLTSNTTYEIQYDDKDESVKYVTITYKYNQNTNTTNDNIDGVGTGTDGTTEDNDENENDGVVDGVVGDAIDDGVDTITDTIMDITGIRTRMTNNLDMYRDIEGFDYDVQTDTENSYTVVYKIDLDKIQDSDLSTFNIDRNLTNLQTTYENLGYTCR